jgi:hypothetical protein
MWDGLDEKTGRRVIRGGVWGLSAGYCTVAYRGLINPVNRSHYDGFRVALSSVP